MKKNILVVDNDKDFLDYISEQLVHGKYNVLTAKNANMAYDLIKERFLSKKGTIDLLITDMIMPEVDGLNSILECRHDFPSMKIIAVSGASNMLSRAKVFGAIDTLSKPFEIDELMFSISKALDV